MSSLYSTIAAERVAARLAKVQPQVRAALEALRRRGVQVRLVGSLADGSFGPHSDVDFLIEDTAGLADGTIYDVITDHLKDARLDMILVDRLAPEVRSIFDTTYARETAT